MTFSRRHDFLILHIPFTLHFPPLLSALVRNVAISSSASSETLGSLEFSVINDTSVAVYQADLPIQPINSLLTPPLSLFLSFLSLPLSLSVYSSKPLKEKKKTHNA